MLCLEFKTIRLYFYNLFILGFLILNQAVLKAFFLDGYGESIILETNARWPYPDMDYTPNMNYISSLWPTLRYNSYSVAVFKAQNMDVTTFYLPSTNLSLSDPCSHPDAIE